MNTDKLYKVEISIEGEVTFNNVISLNKLCSMYALTEDDVNNISDLKGCECYVFPPTPYIKVEVCSAE